MIAFPLICRGRRVGALIGFDRLASARPPRPAQKLLRAVRVLLEPASVALDNALLLKRAEELSVTDDLTQLYNSRFLNLALRRETKRALRSGRPLSLLFRRSRRVQGGSTTMHGHLSGQPRAGRGGGGHPRERARDRRRGPLRRRRVRDRVARDGSRRRVRAWAGASATRIAAHSFLADRGPAICISRPRWAWPRCLMWPRLPRSSSMPPTRPCIRSKIAGKNGIQAAAAPSR